MKNITFILFIFILSLPVAQAQKKYPPLKKETIDLSALSKQHNGDMDIHYLYYKMATTTPENVLTDIDDRYVIKDFNLKKITNDQSSGVSLFLDSISSEINLRIPKSDESPNFIYFEANIGNNPNFSIMSGEDKTTVTYINGNSYLTGSIKNLGNISFEIENRLKKENGESLFLGDECIVTVGFDKNGNTIVKIAIELKDAKFENVAEGSIFLKVSTIDSPKAISINKKGRMKTLFIGSLPIKIIEFDNGVIHYQYLDSDVKYIKSLKIIGVIGDKKFNIQNSPSNLLNLSYEKYRKEPNLSYPKFMDYINSKKGLKFSSDMLQTKVEILNIGYDVDSVILINTKNPIHTNFGYAVLVSKDENSKQKISTLFRNFNFVENLEEVNQSSSMIKKYVTSQVKYPQSAQERKLTASASIQFVLSPSGELTNLSFVNKIDFSFMDAIEEVFNRAPKFRPVIHNGIAVPVVISMRIEFRL